MLKVKDDTLSENFAENPKDNLVVSLDTKLALFRQKLIFGGEISTSLLNNNFSTGVIADSLLDTLGIDVEQLPFSPADIEDIFVINANMEPLMPGLHSIASEAYFRAFFLNNLLNVNYSYVGGSYNSLANPYLQKDKSGLNIKNTLRLLNNQLNLTAGYHKYQNNLSGEKDGTSGTTTSDGFLGNIGYYPQNQNFPSFNLSLQQSNMTNDIPDSTFVLDTLDTIIDTTFNDLYQIDQVNNSIGVNTSYQIPWIEFAKSKLSVSFYNSNSIDNEFEVDDTTSVGADTTLYGSYTANSQNYQFSLSSDFKDIPLNTRISFSSMNTRNYSEPDSLKDEIEGEHQTIRLFGEYRLFDERIKPYLKWSLTNSSGTSDYTKNYYTFGISSRLNLFKKETFISGEISHLDYKYEDDSDNDYSRTKMRLRISQKF